MMRYERLLMRCVRAVAVSLLVVSPSAFGINIVLNFDSGQSVNPTQDATATGLQNLFAYAETYYQDVFEDAAANTTLTLNFWYEDLDSISTTTWGHHALVNETNSGGGQPWREIEANIRLDNDRTWFIDPTPANNSEFTMVQTLWRDLTGTQQNDFYNNFTAANIPETFEVGWRGAAVGGGAADGVADLLTTVMHEVGHSLGMSSSATGTDNEVGIDADYDFNSNFIFGQTLAAEVRSGSVGHIDVDFAMMCGSCAATSLRRLPSHTDLFSMAAGHNYTSLDVPRREFYGGSNWNSAGSWSGNTVPGTADDVFVRDPGAVVTANLTANGVAANLTVAEGGNVDTESFKLDVGGTVLVTDLNTDVFIRSGGELEASTLRIENQGEVRPLTGGLIDVNTLDINDTGSLIGAGTVDVATTLSNDGTITATGGNLLTFTTAGGAVWNLDGSNINTPTLNAISGDISFASGTLSDAFDGDMNVGVGRFINFANGWELGSGGMLTLGGGTVTADRAEVQGNAIVRGDILVDKRGELDGQLTFHTSANIDLPDADDRLDLGNSTADTITYHGGTFTGNGTLVQDGDATVTAGNTVNIDVNSFDFDGDTISDTTLLAGATMNITGTGITDAHNGVITLNSGTLNVATGNIVDFGGFPLFLPVPWEMAGSLVFLDNGTDPVLKGSKVNITGAISVPITGTGRIQAPVEFHPTSNTEITSASDRLILDGTTTFNGGTFTGFGELEQNATATVISNTTLGIGTYDWDGGAGGNTVTHINDGVTFTINASVIDNSGDGFDGTVNVNGGTLAVNTTGTWAMDGNMNLTNTGGSNPTVNGSAMLVSGNLAVTGGQSHINATAAFQPTAVVTVDAGAELELNGISTYLGGSFTGDGTIQLDGTATVNLPTTIDVAQFDMDGTSGNTTVNINDDLTLNVTNIDTGNNNHNGTININSGFAALTVNTPSPWILAGTLNITHGVASTNTSIDGQDFTMSGTANINAWSGWDALATISGTVNVIGAGNIFSVRGGDAANPNTLNGGTITGNGRLSVGTNKRLVGFGTISTSQFSMNLGGRLLADNGTLNVSSTLLSSGLARIGTHDTDGILNVTNAWNTNLYQALELNGGSVTGALITNDGLTTGFGTIATAGGFRNNNILTASGGTLILNPTGALDLDGIGNTGTINALAGDIRVSKNLGIAGFAGTLNIGSGRSFKMDFGGLSNTGQINLTGGTYLAASLDHFGTLDISSSASSIDAATSFENGSTITVNEDLTMFGNLLIRPAASINGTASLIMSPGTTLTALDGVQIGAMLVNDGDVVLGSSPGTLIADDYVQTPGGQIEFELAGLTQGGTYDWLKVGDNATLDGLLEIVLLGGFTPGVGDSFDIISAGSGISGVFSNINFPTIPNFGLGISYTANIATLNAGLLGDLDNDGFVGITDINIILSNWNGNVTAGVWILGEPSGDGFIGIEDLNIVLGNWNAGTPPPAEALALIPEPGVALLMAAGLGTLTTRRRRY